MTERDHSLKHAIVSYLRRCELEGKSPNTVVAYRETLLQLLVVAEAEEFAGDVRKVTPEDIDSYLAWVMARGVCDEPRHRRFREARFLFVWLLRTGLIKHNPFQYLRNIKMPRRIVLPMRAEDIGKLLAAPYPNPIIAIRNKAIILLLLDTGIG